MFTQIAEALVDRGHDVHAVVNRQCSAVKKLSKGGVKVHGFESALGCTLEGEEVERKRNDMLLRPFSFFNSFGILRESKTIVRDETEGMLTDPELLDKLKRLRFDLSIVDALIFSRFLYLLPYKLDIPVVSLLAVFSPLDAGVPVLPSFSPVLHNGQHSDRMTFSERVQNTLLTISSEMFNYVVPGADNNLVTEFAPEKPYRSFKELASNSCLWLIMTDVTIDYPQLRTPHVINIGGINTRPPNPLPDHFRKMADAATDGLIVVSFGSYVADFPEQLRERIYTDLKQLNQTVVWRFKGDPLPDLPPNIHIVDWMPQIDLLAHPNTKVFVTHCGCNGQFEALYHGVPMVGLPLFGDQTYNCLRIAKKGMGIKMDTFSFPPGALVKSINEVISEESYSNAAKHLSRIFRDQPMTPIQRTTYWLEHIMTYGSSHLFPVTAELPWYQLWCLDILALFLVIGIIVAYVFVKVVKYLTRKCCRPSTSLAKHKVQ